MLRRVLPALFAGVVVAGFWGTSAAHAQAPPVQYQNMNRFYYYPYYYFPHNYWPSMSPKWPEGPGQPYVRPPAYQAYPPFKAPNFRYEWSEAQRNHRAGPSFLDQF